MGEKMKMKAGILTVRVGYVEAVNGREGKGDWQ